MKTRFWVSTVAFVVAITTTGCGHSDQQATPSTNGAANSPPAANDSEAANERLAQAIALAKVHQKHGEFQQAETVINQALSDSAATDKYEAIALLDEVKTAVAENAVNDTTDLQPDENGRSEQSSRQPEGESVEIDAAAPRSNDAQQTGNQSEEDDDQDDEDPQEASQADGDDVGESQAAETEQQNGEQLPPAKELPPEDDSPIDPPPKEPATDSMLAALERFARECETAENAYDAYERFIEQYLLDAEQLKTVQSRLAHWKDLADKKLVRVGKKWVTEDEAKAIAEEADRLIDQALQLMAVRNHKGAREFLKRASKIDANGIRADFILGILNSGIFVNHAPTAERHFRRVLVRVPNHLSALNNLALTEVKLRRFSRALDHWRTLITLAPSTPEASQNLGRLISEVQKGKLRVRAQLLEKFSSLYSEVTASGKGKPSNPDAGWFYMPLYLPAKEQQRAKFDPKGTLVAATSGTGFAVHKHYFLTCRHVVEDGAGFSLVDPSDRQKELPAELVAVSDDADLALLKCEQLDVPPCDLHPGPYRRATDIMVIGYPMSQIVGIDIKSTRGAITALPDPTHDNLLMYDAVTNKGNSGGPVCNRHGHVVAVCTAVYTIPGRIGAGTPAKYALPFVRQYVPDLKVASPDDPELDWPDVDAKISASTVFVIVYKKVADVGFVASDAEKRKGNQRFYEDKSCSACNGHKYFPCKVRKCLNGYITIRVPRRVVVGDPNGVNRTVTVFDRKKQRCKTCSGKDRIKCPHCRGSGRG